VFGQKKRIPSESADEKSKKKKEASLACEEPLSYDKQCELLREFS